MIRVQRMSPPSTTAFTGWSNWLVILVNLVMPKSHFAGWVAYMTEWAAWLGPAGWLSESSLLWFICFTYINKVPVFVRPRKRSLFFFSVWPSTISEKHLIIKPEIFCFPVQTVGQDNLLSRLHSCIPSCCFHNSRDNLHQGIHI